MIKLMGKMGRLMKPIWLLLIHLILLVAHLFYHHGYLLLKLLIVIKIYISQDPGHIQFVCSFNNDQYKDIISYNNIINHITHQEDEDVVCKFKHIVAQEWPLIAYHRNYKGSWYSVIVERDIWKTNTQPLSVMTEYSPIVCDLYAYEEILL